jgi:hypothetical protein
MMGCESEAFEASCDGHIAKPIDTRAPPAVVARYWARPMSEEEAHP